MEVDDNIATPVPGGASKRSSGFPGRSSIVPTSSIGLFGMKPSMIDKIADRKVMTSISCEDRALESDGNKLSSSRMKLEVETHPLRWDSAANKPRFEAHEHPLRLVNSKDIYPSAEGNYVCDAGRHHCYQAGYVFNCPICQFDICLECVAKPCFTCTKLNCCHTQITMKMV